MSRTLGLISLLVVPFLVATTLRAAAEESGSSIPDSLPFGVTPEMIDRGYRAFHGEGLCINCHGEQGAGLLGPSLVDAEWWHAAGNYLSIIRQVLVGIPEDKSLSGEEMPPRGGADLTDSEVIAVSAYVWRVSHPREETFPLGVTEEIVEMGGDIFHNIGDCADCHGADAEGDTGPNLTDEEWLHARGSYLAIANQIMRGVPLERSRTGVVMPPRGGSNLSEEDVYAVAAYVWSISRLGESKLSGR